MLRLRALVVASVVGIALAACGGGGSGGSNGGSGGSGSGGGGTTTTNPCSTALTEDTAQIAAVGTVAQSGAPATDKKTLVDGDPRGRLAEAIALNRKAEEYRKTLQIRPSWTGSSTPSSARSRPRPAPRQSPRTSATSRSFRTPAI